jgi:hypothetical protein
VNRYLFVCLALGLAACSDPAPACTVKDNGDGTRSVACVDGTRVTLPSGEGTCTLGAGEDGGKVILCSDGTEVRIGPDGLPVFHGGGLVAGTVRLYGRDRHDGVTVTSRWTGEHAVTAADGTFRLEVRAGNHDLSFEHPDFAPLVVPGVPAVGPYALPTVILHPSERLAGDGAADWPSPDETAIAFRPRGNALSVRRVADHVDVSLSEGASFPPAWDGEGGAIAFLEGQDGWDGHATLVRYDPGSGTRDELSAVATRVLAWPGGGLLYWELGAGGEERVLRWTASGGAVDLGPAPRWSNPVFTADGGAVFLADSAGRLVWREADGRGAVLAGVDPWPVLPAPFGPWVALVEPGGAAQVLDRRDGTLADLGAAPSVLRFSPDGTRLLFDRAGAAVVRKLETGEAAALAGVGAWCELLEFTADGGVLGACGRELTLVRPDGSAEEVANDVSFGTVALSPDRIRALLRHSGSTGWEVRVVAGRGDPLVLGTADWFAWTADGRRLLGQRIQGSYVKVDAVDGGEASFARTANGLVPFPGGRRVLWSGLEDEKPVLFVHDLPSGTEVRLASGSFDGYGFSADGAAVAYRTCGTVSCDLWYWAGGDAPVPVHDSVSQYVSGTHLVVYRFQPPSDHVEASRSGLWFARLPAQP